MTNVVLNLLVLAAVVVGLGPRLRRLRPGPIAVTAVVMLALTAVFDTAMIGAGLYTYSADRILGLRVASAPIEDFAYPLAAVVAMPALWTALGRRAGRRSRGSADAPGPESRS